MGLFDKAKELAEQHGDKLGGAVDKLADVVDEKTGGKYTDKIESGTDKAKEYLSEGNQEPPSKLAP